MRFQPLPRKQHDRRMSAWALLPLLLLLYACPERASAPKSRELELLSPERRARAEQLLERTQAGTQAGQAWGELGFLYCEQDLWPAARAAFEQAALLERERPHWVYHAARTARAGGDLAGARALLSAGQVSLERFAPAQHLRGLILLELGQYVEALTAFELTMRLLPGRPEGWLGLGQVKLAQGDAQAASQALVEALRLDPDYAAAHYWYAQALLALGRTAEAQQELQLGSDAKVRLLPDELTLAAQASTATFEDTESQVRSALTAGNPELALKQIDGYLQRAPEDGLGHALRGQVLMARSQPKLALASFDRALALRKDDKKILAMRGVAHMQAGDRELALADLQRAVELDANSVEAHVNLSTYYMELGQPEQAIIHAERGLAVDSQAIEPALVKARSLIALGRLDEAYAIVEQLAIRVPQHAQVLETYGRLLVDRAEWERAKTVLEAAAIASPRTGHIWYQLARAAAGLERAEDVRNALRKARELGYRRPEMAQLEARFSATTK